MAAAFAQRGFSLVEVLVATVVLTVGMVGLAALLATGLRDHVTAHRYNQATLFAHDMLDRLRADRAEAMAGRHDTVPTGAPREPAASSVELLDWQRLLADRAGARGAVSCDPLTTVCRVVVAFPDRQGGWIEVAVAGAL